MKKYHTSYIAALMVTSIILITSCEREIKFTGKQSQKVLVMNSEATDGYMDLVLTPSKFIFGTDPEENWYVEDRKDYQEIDKAKVTVTLNDREIEMQKDGIGIYGYKGNVFEPGDKFSIHVEAGRFGTVTANDIYPHAPEIISVDTTRFFDKEDYTLYLRTMIKIKDRPGEMNYYRLLHNRYYIQEHNGREELGARFNDFNINQDIAMSSLTTEGIQGDDSNEFRIFPDDLFDGNEYVINIYYPIAYGSDMVKNKVLVEFELQSLNKAYYMYMRTLEQSYNSDIFTQPVRLYSNVSNGYGIFALSHSNYYSFYVMPDEGSGKEDWEYWNK